MCAYAHNYIGIEQKEAISVKVDLVVVQLYIGLYWSDLGKQRLSKTLSRSSFHPIHRLYQYVYHTSKY